MLLYKLFLKLCKGWKKLKKLIGILKDVNH